MSIAACDPEAFYPLRSLVKGPFENLDDLPAIERFVRTVVLHDEIYMEGGLLAFDPEAEVEFSEEEKQADRQSVIVALRPSLDGYDFFADTTGPPVPVPEVELSQALIETAAQSSNAGEGSVYFKAHVDYLKRLIGLVEQGGSGFRSAGRVAASHGGESPKVSFSAIMSGFLSLLSVICSVAW